MWLLLMLMHLTGLVGYSIVLRKSLVAKADKWVLAALLSSGITVPLLPFVFFGVIDASVYSPSIIGRLLLTVGLEITLQLSLVNALQRLQSGVFSIVYNIRVVFATILGIVFLSEEVIALQIIGGLLILSGVILASNKHRKSLNIAGVLWGVAAAASVSLLNLSHKSLIDDIGYFNDIIPVMILASMTLWVIVFSRRKHVTLSSFWRFDMLRLMIFRGMAAHGIILALAAGAVISVANYISSLSVIIIVALGALFLNERDHIKEKIVATGLAALGLTFILLANI